MVPKKYLFLPAAAILLSIASSGCFHAQTEESVEENSVTVDQEAATDARVETLAMDESELEGADRSAQDSENLQAAMEANDLSQCEAIENSKARESCVNTLTIEMAKESNDPAVCDPIEDEFVQATCLEKLGENA